MKKSVLAVALIASSISVAQAKVGDNEGDEKYFLGGIGINDDSNGVNLTAGFQFHRQFYVELSSHINSDSESIYDRSSSNYINKADLDTSIYTIALTPVLMGKIDDNFGVFMKGGVYYAKANLDLKTSSGVSYPGYYENVYNKTYSHSESWTNFTYGLGLQYMHDKPMFGDAKFTLRMGVDWYEIGTIEGIDFGRTKVIGLQMGVGF
ncbi:putative OMP_b-brl domain-containing protein [Vibrio chagasii]|nr:putative OMP_b-brl domain-containing protein [Vibrio chagasii]